MLNGLDLFSGIGGLTIALSDWVRPVAYCEIERYASAVLLSRMSEGKLPAAPIWDDVTTLRGKDLPEIDIIYGGFPCQDISVAGNGKGLAGERSGLFFEIVRLAKEIKPKFIFLENVPAITSRGGVEVVNQITEMGYDCRWTCLSAAEVGANHRRERWWLLGYAKHYGQPSIQKLRSDVETSNERREKEPQSSRQFEGTDRSFNVPSLQGGQSDSEWDAVQEGIVTYSRRISERADKDLRSQVQESIGKNLAELCSNVSNSSSLRPQEQGQSKQSERSAENQTRQADWANSSSWWSTEPELGRVANGIPFRVDRLKGLGNAVVPIQAREAFKELIGF